MVSYGRKIDKIECTNLVIKNYTKALMKLQGVSSNVKTILTRPLIRRLVKDARAAIIQSISRVIMGPKELKYNPQYIFKKKGEYFNFSSQQPWQHPVNTVFVCK
jgi:hypothetical protein